MSTEIEAKISDVPNQMRKLKYEYMEKYNLRDEDIKGYSLGPNEFLSFRIEMTRSFQRFQHIGQEGILPSSELSFEGHCVFCSDNHGVHILVDKMFHIMVEEARKNLDLKGMN